MVQENTKLYFDISIMQAIRKDTEVGFVGEA